MAESFYPNALNSDLNFYIDDVKTDAFNEGVSLYEKGVFYWQTSSMAQFQDWSNAKWYVGNPCGEGTMGEINNAIQKLFVILRGVQKYNDLYVKGTINKVQNLQGQISKLTSTVAGVLKTLVQRTRNWILNKIRSLLTDAVEKLLPPLLKQIKDSLISSIIDQIFCAFEDIIKSLVELVADFLYSLIGQIIQAPFCAAEQWANALINKLVNQIDSALKPIFDQVNNILSGVAEITGSVSSAIDLILGFQGFLCAQPECPELKEFQASLWGGPSQTMKDNFNNFGISDSFAGEITQTTDQWLNDFFGPESGTLNQSPGSCYTGTFECGIPQVQIFGGGGSGAIAQAVVNNIGQVIGTNLLNGGESYTSPPFVSIVDPGGCGSNASAFAVWDRDTGAVVDIVINNPGSGYDDGYSGGAPVVNSFIGAPNPINVGKSVTLSWEVVNADKVSLNLPGYNNLPLVGSVSVPVKEEDVYFAPNSDTATITYTLTAIKNNKNSADQVVTKEFILTVLLSGSSGGGDTDSSPPVIDSFAASPSESTPGSIVTLSWETTNTTSVSIDIPGYASVPEDGSISVVIPSDITFPSNGSNVIKNYTLTANNSNASPNKQKVSQTIGITIRKPSDITGVGTVTTGIGTDDSVVYVDTINGGTVITQPGVGGDGVVIGGVPVSDITNPNDSSGTGNNNAIAVISGVDVINTGIGYTSGDTTSLDDEGDLLGGSGASFDLQVNASGQVTSVNVNSGGYGFTTIPNLSINSREGSGAQFRVKLKFIPLNQFLAQQQVEIDPTKLVQVIDCVTR